MGCLGKGGATPYRDGGAWRSSGKVPIMGVPSSLSLLSIGDIENFSRTLLCMTLKVLFVPSCKFPASRMRQIHEQDQTVHSARKCGCR